MVVISIQTTNLLGFLGALQLSAHKAEFAHCRGSQCPARCDIVISGGTGAGKTTLLNVLSGLLSLTPNPTIFALRS